MAEQITFLRFPDVIKRVGIKRTQIYRRMRAGLFPMPVPLAGRALGWIESSIDEYNRLIAEARSEETIKEFVRSLAPRPEARRKRVRANDASTRP